MEANKNNEKPTFNNNTINHSSSSSSSDDDNYESSIVEDLIHPVVQGLMGGALCGPVGLGVGIFSGIITAGEQKKLDKKERKIRKQEKKNKNK